MKNHQFNKQNMKPYVYGAKKHEFDIILTIQGYFHTVHFERHREEFKRYPVNDKGLRGEHSFNQ